MNSVQLDDGTSLPAAAVVVATEVPETARLVEDFEPRRSRSVSCLYFASSAVPTNEPMLILNGTGSGPVNNMCVPSLVAPTLAPQGEALVSITVPADHAAGDHELKTAVPRQLEEWFGNWVRSWRHLRTYHIAHAQPEQSPGVLDPPERPVTSATGVFVCGNHRDNASINGALTSGRRAAEAVIIARSRRRPD